MAMSFPRHAYLQALGLLVANMKNPPRTAAEMHALIARQNPRLFSAHADAFDARPADPAHTEPTCRLQPWQRPALTGMVASRQLRTRCRPGTSP
jgi:hypothetical protein